MQLLKEGYPGFIKVKVPDTWRDIDPLVSWNQCGVPGLMKSSSPSSIIFVVSS